MSNEEKEKYSCVKNIIFLIFFCSRVSFPLYPEIFYMPDSNPNLLPYFCATTEPPHLLTRMFWSMSVFMVLRWTTTCFMYTSLSFSSSMASNISWRVGHRRRMEREAKTNVVTYVWGAEFVQFLATLAVWPWHILIFERKG